MEETQKSKKIETECAKVEAVDDNDSENVVDIDAEDHDNPFCCAEYAEEIYRYMKKREVGLAVLFHVVLVFPRVHVPVCSRACVFTCLCVHVPVCSHMVHRAN